MYPSSHAGESLWRGQLVDPFGLQEGSPQDLAARKRIADLADSYNGNSEYEFAKKKSKWPANTNTCNAFVCDVTRAGRW